ncbi:phenylalanine--tRNA ligase subunit beta [Aestuariivirga sp.]|uniref:phenylalanine--tRNA ligase subunit beta n=1 Tax=Aestuariivirga sp. TaxID=2650926 RepID=UPI0025C6BCD1|nr:phenylalanine--tRNA ligase subunit beta [Aestuariivirga sp.]MCA3555633.1 phenylalanine--tRNA ligase subunit beta [Aestuariivirga sp.]
MKFTLSWLKDYLDTTATLDEICEGLVGVGLEVEEATDKTKLLADFTVAHVMLAEKHPNADKLRLCAVETKDGTKQVVCGAPNARTGIKAIIALPGVTIPATGAVFAPATIRGVESQAMLCSERELLISDEHDGIIEVEGDWPVGTPAAKALGLDDPMIYVKVTPNRPDALGIYGIARDLAAKGLGTLRPLDAGKVEGTFDSPIKVSLDFPDGDTRPCPLFVGRYIRGMKNGPSPEWLQRRLKAIGLRPISTLVDVTNYITFAYGRPLHVFDADKVKGAVRARPAKDGEMLEALDNKTYTLSEGMTVIADDAGLEAIAGIIGGIPSSCTDDTVNVFLEAAYFDPLRTAATGRRLGITSDARYRFERGVDPAFTPVGSEIATRMILDLCGGEASHVVVVGAVPDTSRSYTLRKTRVASLAGVEIPVARQKEILAALGYGVTETADALTCSAPSWRPDIHGEADLVEEVIRIWGLDNIPARPMERASAIAKPVLNPLQKRMLGARRALASRGFNEAITWAFLSEEHARLFGGGQPELKLANPISSELSDMRPSLLPNLIAAAGRNMDRGFADMMLAEVGHAYAGDQPKDETLRAAGLRRGAFTGRNVHGGARAVDAFDAKADALAVLEAAGAAVATLQVVAGAPAWFHPGRSGAIQMGPQNKLGFFGEIHPRVLGQMDVKGPLVAFEIILTAIPGSKSRGATRAALVISDLMPLSRDFAFVVDDAVEADKLVKAAKGADKALIADVTVFDLYKLEGGKKSLAIEVTLQPKDKTLTEPEIEAVSQKIVQAVTKATGGTLRS